LVRREAAHVHLVGRVAARARADRDGGSALLRRPLARRPQPRDRDAHALAGGAHHLGLGAPQRRDGAAHADVRRLDGIADRELAGGRRGPREVGERALGPARALGGGSERPVLLRLPAGAPRAAKLAARILELGAHVAQLPLRERPALAPCRLALLAGAGELALELRLAPLERPG